VDSEEMNNEQEIEYWHIDVDWLENNNRSFLSMAERCFCSDCTKRLKKEQVKLTPEEAFNNIKDCCSGNAGFICNATPIMESTFRLFLANGNQALDLIEMGRQLSNWRGIDTYRTSVDILSRLLKKDLYYGIRPVEQ